MSSFELNKVAASILVALIVAMVCGLIAESLVEPKHLAHNAYVVAGVEKSAAAAPAAGAAPAAKAEPIAPLLAAATPAAGEVVAKKCLACHSFEKGAPNKVGPNLFGVIGAKHGHAEGFAYSAGMKAKEGAWGPEELNQFLNNPKGYVAGTKMAFAGLPKAEDRANVIAYLNSMSDAPKDLKAAK